MTLHATTFSSSFGSGFARASKVFLRFLHIGIVAAPVPVFEVSQPVTVFEVL